MEAGEHRSKGRIWAGTFVIGGVGGDIWVAEGWKGWVNVEREGFEGFPMGVGVREVVGERVRRQEVVDGKGWRARERGGEGFLFSLENSDTERQLATNEENRQ